MCRTAAIGLALAAWSAPAAAQVTALYDAGTGPAVLHPSNHWGWVPQNFVANETAGAPLINDAGTGNNAWRIDDGGAVLNQPLYSTCVDFEPTVCGVGPVRGAAVQNGWRFSAIARYDADHSTANNGQGNMGLSVWMDNRGYYVLLDLVNNDLRATVYRGQLQTRQWTLTTGGSGTAAYHDLALRFSPVSQSVFFEFDGRVIDTTVGQVGTGHPNTLEWGNLGRDRGRMNFHEVAFQVLLPGDYNRDGRVDGGDYVTWRNHLGTAFAAADGNGNGTVNAADYGIWKNQYGAAIVQGSGVGGVTTVPEPTLAALWTAAMCGVFTAIGRHPAAPFGNRPPCT